MPGIRCLQTARRQLATIITLQKYVHRSMMWLRQIAQLSTTISMSRDEYPHSDLEWTSSPSTTDATHPRPTMRQHSTIKNEYFSTRLIFEDTATYLLDLEPLLAVAGVLRLTLRPDDRRRRLGHINIHVGHRVQSGGWSGVRRTWGGDGGGRRQGRLYLRVYATPGNGLRHACHKCVTPTVRVSSFFQSARQERQIIRLAPVSRPGTATNTTVLDADTYRRPHGLSRGPQCYVRDAAFLDPSKILPRPGAV